MGVKSEDIRKAEDILGLKPGSYTKATVLRNYREHALREFPRDSADEASTFLNLCWAFKLLYDGEDVEVDKAAGVELFRLMNIKDFFTTNPDGFDQFRFHDLDDFKALRQILKTQMDEDRKLAMKQKEAQRADEEREQAERTKAKKKKKKAKGKKGKGNAEDESEGEDAESVASGINARAVTKDKKPGAARDDSESETENAPLDLNSAFIAKAVQKHAPGAVTAAAAAAAASTKQAVKKKTGKGQQNELPDIMPASLAPMALHSKKPSSVVVAIPEQAALPPDKKKEIEQLYSLAQQFKNEKRYVAAITTLDSAIERDPSDPKLLSFRSYCHLETESYDDALPDAERIIQLAPSLVNGYIYKARALLGLERFAEAESAFEEAAQVDPKNEYVQEGLKKTRISCLMSMGFDEAIASAALIVAKTVPAAVEFITGGVAKPTANKSAQPAARPAAAVANAPRAAAAVAPIQQQAQMRQKAAAEQPVARPAPQKAVAPTASAAAPRGASAEPALSPFDDPKNPMNLCTIIVLNVETTVTEAWLKKEFSTCGRVLSVYQKPEKFVAFINYATGEDASKALVKYQNMLVDGRRFRLRFQPPRDYRKVPPNPSQDSRPYNQIDCNFWQNTGCMFGTECRYRHDPKLKGAMLR